MRRVLSAAIGVMSLAVAASVAFGPEVELTDRLAARVDQSLVTAVGETSAVISVADGSDLADALAAAEELGLTTRTTWPRINAFVADGPQSALLALARVPSIARMDHNVPMRLYTDTSHLATHGEDVLVGDTVRTPAGELIDGRGVGLAIVDTGVDGTHPDLSSRQGANVRFTGPGVLLPLDQIPDSDLLGAGGHGTHVAGAAVGDGTLSESRFHGAAPGATWYGVGSGTVVLLENGVNGLNWVLENHDAYTPNIKVVNNSWGSAAAEYDPDAAVHRVVEALVDEGVVVVWAAGNDGGDGSTQTTSLQCVNPTPGVICVASAYDRDQGVDERALVSSYSSRGLEGDPKTYPDIAAPGESIVSTCRLTLPVCSAEAGPETDPPNGYSTLSGTSMAAPHIAGIVAQMFQVDPTLTPAEVEYLLEDTATKFEYGGDYEVDPFSPAGTTTSFDKGHGLVNVLDAVITLYERNGVTGFRRQ